MICCHVFKLANNLFSHQIFSALSLYCFTFVRKPSQQCYPVHSILYIINNVILAKLFNSVKIPVQDCSFAQISEISISVRLTWFHWRRFGCCWSLWGLAGFHVSFCITTSSPILTPLVVSISTPTPIRPVPISVMPVSVSVTISPVSASISVVFAVSSIALPICKMRTERMREKMKEWGGRVRLLMDHRAWNNSLLSQDVTLSVNEGADLCFRNCNILNRFSGSLTDTQIAPENPINCVQETL